MLLLQLHIDQGIESHQNRWDTVLLTHFHLQKFLLPCNVQQGQQVEGYHRVLGHVFQA